MAAKMVYKLLALTIITASLNSNAYAGVFKCLINDKVIYQPNPCTQGIGDAVNIRPRSAEAEAEAETKLRSWRSDKAEVAAIEKATQNQAREYANRAAQIDAANALANDRAIAQENVQANQADALTKINKKLNQLRTQQMLNNNEQQLYNMRQ